MFIVLLKAHCAEIESFVLVKRELTGIANVSSYLVSLDYFGLQAVAEVVWTLLQYSKKH